MTARTTAITVVGGTYLDEELLVTEPIRHDVSLTVAHRTTSLGGPGFCYARRLAGHGLDVRLETALGDCAHSRAGLGLLHRHGVACATEQQTGRTLDVATVVIDPLGRKLALNGYHLAGRIECTPATLAAGVPVLVASPTRIGTLVTAVRTLHRGGGALPPLFLAPHSRQVAEILDLPAAARGLLGQVTTAVSVNEADLTPRLEEVFAPTTLLIVTRGEKGCSVRQGRAWSHHEPARLDDRVMNSNGAGEAFFAGVVSRLLTDRTVADAVDFGARTAAAYLRELQACRTS
ncbi:Sugar or nucleoside kinase, ribokinase family [Streptomyces sp. TLI_053]|uniref:carbohydrate kinase family protein n=1 Tax=Streptomyces sp. TLI_053 TaxID=1855352 RepID=UPI00087BB647|nr:PfkB family carbohydrate kinase [Streptomyces sp. TLI_053]SDT83349.1 Sugar or nucleoside kinase, ribokinase family [Streptomyces sp. TLI_053]